MRILTLAAVAAALALPSTAGAAAVAPPSSCDLIKNTICQYLPPTSVEDVCGIVGSTTALSCTVSTVRAAAGPELPSSGCDLQKKLGIVNVRQCEDGTSV